MSVLARIQAIGNQTWLRIVRYLNVIVASILGGAVLLNQAYPNILDQLDHSFPSWVKFVAGIAWFSFIHYALTQAKGGPNAPTS